MIQLRPERPEDAAAIRELHRLAFGGEGEAGIVDAVRTAGAAVLSMVAVDGPGPEEPGPEGPAPERAAPRGAVAERPAPCDFEAGSGRVVAHILYTWVTVTAVDGGQTSLLGLAPMAVLPSRQGAGIGTMLVEASLEQLRAEGHSGVVVVGHPGYYPRFGFLPASRWGLRWEVEVPDEVFMAAELSPGSLADVRGLVRFRPEFAQA